MPFLVISSTIIILTGSLEGSDGSGPLLPSHNPLTANLSRTLEDPYGRLMSMVDGPKLHSGLAVVRYNHYATA